MEHSYGPDLRLLTGERFYGDSPVKIRCPLHNDTDKSWAIYPQSSFCYGACRQWHGYRDTVKLLGGSFPDDATSYVPTTEEATVNVDDVQEMVGIYHERLFMMNKEGYLTGPKRGLTLETIRRAKLGYNGFAYSIPIYSFGAFQTIRYRRDPMEPGEPKYWGTKHLNKPTLFCPTPLASRVIWVEGEFDALIAGQCGYSVVTMTNGIGSTPTQEISTALWDRGIKRIDVVVDLDRASFGRAFEIADTLEQQAPFDVQIRRLPTKDITELYTKRGEPGVHVALAGIPFTVSHDGEPFLEER